tara:strand:+ start:174 stop:662 length:489 start_codon:yes stop_codon:yes gene_type:complete
MGVYKKIMRKKSVSHLLSSTYATTIGKMSPFKQACVLAFTGLAAAACTYYFLGILGTATAGYLGIKAYMALKEQSEKTRLSAGLAVGVTSLAGIHQWGYSALRNVTDNGIVDVVTTVMPWALFGIAAMLLYKDFKGIAAQVKARNDYVNAMNAGLSARKAPK